MKRIHPACVLFALLPAPLAAQHEHGRPPSVQVAYDTIYSMAPELVEQLRTGQGMKLALAAELNSYPGPKHAIELARELRLSPEQLARIEAIDASMRSRAIETGLELLATESELTTLFRDGAADPSRVAALTARVGAISGRLRAIHLQAHLETRAAFMAEQVRLYDKHRGYDAGGESEPRGKG